MNEFIKALLKKGKERLDTSVEQHRYVAKASIVDSKKNKKK